MWSLIGNNFGRENKEISFLGDSGRFVFAPDWPKMTTAGAWGKTGLSLIVGNHPRLREPVKNVLGEFVR